VTTAEGFLELALPRVRETEEPFHSRLSPLFKKGSDMRDWLVREMVQDRHLKPLGHPSNQTKYRNKIPRRSNKFKLVLYGIIQAVIWMESQFIHH